MAYHNQHHHLSQEQMALQRFADQTTPSVLRTILPDQQQQQQPPEAAVPKADQPHHHLGTGPNWLSNAVLRSQTDPYGAENAQRNQNTRSITTAGSNFLNLHTNSDSTASQQASNQWLSRTTIDDSVLTVPHGSAGLSSDNNADGNNSGDKVDLADGEVVGGSVEGVMNWQNAKYKAEILAHPLYEQLLSAHVACLKIATPVDQLPRIDAQLAQSEHVVAKYSALGNGQTMAGDDKELDQFMTHYVLLLCSFKEILQQHVRVHAMEAVMACWEIEQSLHSLTGASPGEGTGATMSDDDDEPVDSDANLFDGGLDGPDSMGFGPLIPSESERSLMERVRQELKHELKQGYKEKIVDIREEILRKRRAGKLPGDTTSVLKAWWQSHSKWPYPTAPDEVDPFNALSALFQSTVVNGRAQFASLREENGRLQQRVAQLEALLAASKARVTRLVGDMVGRYSPSEARQAMEDRYWDGIRLCRRIVSLEAPHIPEGVLHPGNAGIEEASRLKTFPEEAGPSSLPD